MARSRSRSRSSPPRRRRKRQRARSSPSRSRQSRSPSRRRVASRSRRARSRSPSYRRPRARSASRSFPSRDHVAEGDAPSRIFVAHADCAKIIGRKGETRMEIERSSEASIKIQREEDMDSDRKERWVDIIGNARQRRAALERILDVANYVRDEDGKVLKDGASVPAPGAGDALILQISCNEVGRVLGRGGETIRRLEDESRARLEIDKGEGRLTISGRPECIERAKELVLQEVSHCKLADGTVLKDDGRPMGPGGGAPAGAGKEGFKLWVLGKEAGKVIGRGGETVREIMQRTGAEIQVERTENKDQGHAERMIQIFGSKAQIGEAFPLIIKDVSFARSELGLVKDPAMTPEEAADAARLRGPGGGTAMPFPGGPPPPGAAAPPFFPATMPGMPPPPGMMTMPPPGMVPMPGMPPGMPPTMPPTMPPGHMPPFPNGVPPGMPPPPPGSNPECKGRKSRSRSRSSSSRSEKKKKKKKDKDKDKDSSALAKPPMPFLPHLPHGPPHMPPEFMGPPEHFPPGMVPMMEEPIDWDDL
ncbi:unnamed protein product [Durusdinium trenchii]|uniref:K Homology domain-containing protein n=2 Tax=Durusdinium trenchii TaxID=1381693 RepID=A0ABP0P7T6_9DINO